MASKAGYRAEHGHLNLEIAFYETDANEYGIPVLQPLEKLPRPKKWIGFNYALGCNARRDYGVHFHLDDYQFNRVWEKPNQYLEVLRQFRCVFSPDFSVYYDYPFAQQIWNHYRKHWLARFWQENGLTVIPSIGWSDERSFRYCFLGEPKNSYLAVSTVSVMNSAEGKRIFYRGWDEMWKQLEPKGVILYGKMPEGIEGVVMHIKPYQDRFEEMKQKQAQIVLE